MTPSDRAGGPSAGPLPSRPAAPLGGRPPYPATGGTRYVLLGDGQSPHLLKWACALAPRVVLYAASSRGFLPGFDAVLPAERRLALNCDMRFDGGNAGLLRQAPRLARWLRGVRPQWVHAHYLTSHGTLAWLALRGLRAPGRLLGSAWGSDILVTPRRSAAARWLLRRVFKACTLATSDSQHMAQRMHELGAGEVMVFPFGLEALPAPATAAKDDNLFFANRGLEAVYRPLHVLALFAKLKPQRPQARLVVANDGALRSAMQRQALALGLGDSVQFVGRLSAQDQAAWYQRARWYISLPESDSVAVSVLEAMAHGCVPLLADLPANRELVRDMDNGVIVVDEAAAPDLAALLPRADAIAQANRAWVQQHALFPQAVDAFLARLGSA